MSENKLPDFAGKLVLFYTADAPRGIQDGVLMEFVTFTEYGGRLFLKGRIPSVDEDGMEWVSNLQAGISWNDVTHYVVFDSREDYMARMGTAKVPFFRRLLGQIF
ncbi:MAG: hypothetical protein JSW39_13610 [Desulfobacterales bacterium]|nr:MAG: hypothetical protein JSW39_13610 [Desulfobacterales bacterium]